MRLNKYKIIYADNDQARAYYAETFTEDEAIILIQAQRIKEATE